MKRVFLMQGCSGSGKSTIVEALEYAFGVEEVVAVVSADHYWYLNDSSKYDFKVSELGKAHRWAQTNAKKYMEKETPTIIIDNTNINQRSAQPYIDMAKEYGYEVRVVRVDCNIDVAKKYNSQRSEDRIIPEHVIDRQYNSIERVEL